MTFSRRHSRRVTPNDSKAAANSAAMRRSTASSQYPNGRELSWLVSGVFIVKSFACNFACICSVTCNLIPCQVACKVECVSTENPEPAEAIAHALSRLRGRRPFGPRTHGHGGPHGEHGSHEHGRAFRGAPGFGAPPWAGAA